MSLALIVALPFIAALVSVCLPAPRRAHPVVSAIALVLALTLLLQQAPAVLSGQIIRLTVPWIPYIGLNASFRLDRQALFCALITLACGSAMLWPIAVPPRAKILPPLPIADLMLVQGAALGIILTDNILFSVLFWQVPMLLAVFGTSGRAAPAPLGVSAGFALARQISGGIALTGGLLLLAQIAQSPTFSGLPATAAPRFPVAIALISFGAFIQFSHRATLFPVLHAIISGVTLVALILRLGPMLIAFPARAGGVVIATLIAAAVATLALRARTLRNLLHLFVVMIATVATLAAVQMQHPQTSAPPDPIQTLTALNTAQTDPVAPVFIDLHAMDTFGVTIAFALIGLISAAIAPLRAPAGFPPRWPAGAILLSALLICLGSQFSGGSIAAGMIMAALPFNGRNNPGSSATRAPSGQSLIALGLIIAGLTGTGSWLLARPFLTASYIALPLPPFGTFSIGTGLIFHTGIFLAIFGATHLIIANLHHRPERRS